LDRLAGSRICQNLITGWRRREALGQQLPGALASHPERRNKVRRHAQIEAALVFGELHMHYPV
jgi:hypothetical protein